MQINYLAIAAGTVFAVLFSALYYFLLNKQVVALRASKLSKNEDVRTIATPNKILVELVRTFVVGLVLAYAVQLLGIVSFQQVVVLTFWLWLGFPVVLFVGQVIHEHFPGRLAAIHAGDWLVKLLILTTVLAFWR